MEQFC
jgi:alpha-tubulin suppressor-like RCC1 family protein